MLLVRCITAREVKRSAKAAHAYPNPLEPPRRPPHPTPPRFHLSTTPDSFFPIAVVIRSAPRTLTVTDIGWFNTERSAMNSPSERFRGNHAGVLLTDLRRNVITQPMSRGSGRGASSRQPLTRTQRALTVDHKSERGGVGDLHGDLEGRTFSFHPPERRSVRISYRSQAAAQRH